MTAGGAHIAAVDYALPDRRVMNTELGELHPEWKMSRVVHLTGVESRHWAQTDETALDLGEAACRRLLVRTGLDPTNVDAILFCTQSPDYIMPPNACLLQHRLGVPDTVAALDFTLACSGFVYGLWLAKALIESGSARNVLLVTAETYSKWTRPDDRGTMTLFGDGAAAALISAGRAGLGAFQLATDGSGGACFMVPTGGAREPRSAAARSNVDGDGQAGGADHIVMDGNAVLEFIKREVPKLARTLLTQAELTLDDLDLVVFHQGSLVSLAYLYRVLGVPEHKRFTNIDHVGNTVSASIPIALREAELQGVLRPGMRVMLVGFGVGLSWGGCIVTWQEEGFGGGA